MWTGGGDVSTGAARSAPDGEQYDSLVDGGEVVQHVDKHWRRFRDGVGEHNTRARHSLHDFAWKNTCIRSEATYCSSHTFC